MSRRIFRLGQGAILLATMIGLVLMPGFTSAKGTASDEKGVRVVPNEAQRRVDVFVDGKLFTAYIWPTSLKKPVLYPINTAQGTPITRGYPLDPRPNERVDHPHHVGLWFNYGDVNGLDFWNNSTATKPENAPKMGTIVHRSIKNVKSGKDRGELEVVLDWVNSDNKPLMREETTFIFRATPTARSIDRISKLIALDAPVSLKDNKEGMLGLRVRRELEHPTKEPLVFTDASGKPTAVPKLDNTGVSGLYLSSNGLKGDAVWGTRGDWVILTGKVGEEPITVSILDHPKNPGYPTYWHARGYGLFAANPLGQKALSNGKEELNYALAANQSTTFRHRILILSATATAEQAQEQHKQFLKDSK